ncbi:MAG: DMT family transporter [Thermaerobacter sp.]|nr:DMT family transporter [Thermaerobacter sp.]
MTRAWWWGAVGMLGFSLTLPATQMGDPSLGPDIMGMGRAAAAALVAAAWLWLLRRPFPRRHVVALVVVGLGVVIGFPWLSAVALTGLPAANGAVVVALLPLATAWVGARRAHEVMPAGFWVAAGTASGVVLVYALLTGGKAAWPDLALVGAVAAAAVGYAEGGRLARQMPAADVICWALVLVSPAALGVAATHLPHDWSLVPTRAWAAFAYVALGSQLAAFFAWYRGLALGGVARVSQVQYVQLFCTLGWSAWLLGEPLTWQDALAAVLVVGSVALGQRARLSTGLNGIGAGANR